MAESQESTIGRLVKPLENQTIETSPWTPVVPHQHESSATHDRLNASESQLRTITINKTPYDHIYKTEIIIQPTLKASMIHPPVAICHKCKSGIDDNQSKITFNNRLYHIGCFRCGICRKDLSNSEKDRFSIDDNGDPMCSQCQLTTAKTCNVCMAPIVTEGLVKFDNMNYHKNCFRCNECRRLLGGEEKALVYNSKPCCTECYKSLFAPRCSKCNQAIYQQQWIYLDGKKYHENCFCCGQCYGVITDPKYHVHLGEPCCSKCFNERIGFRCADCFKVISDEKFLSCNGKHYHTDCFCCGICRKSLANEKDLFRHNDKPCCIRCHEKFLPQCAKCLRPIADVKYITFNDQNFHDDCFICWKCGRVIRSWEKFNTDRIGTICSKCG